jgi:uncharacterized membrane protein
MAGPPSWVTRLFTEEDLAVIARSVEAAERRTSAEIRVHLERRLPRRPLRRAPDVLERARQVFDGLGMHRTRDRNGVLIYLALEDRRLAVLGDEAVHARVGEAYWAHVREVMVDRLRRQAPREAILAAIGDLVTVLAAHFPPRPDDTDELPDRVSLDP